MSRLFVLLDDLIGCLLELLLDMISSLVEWLLRRKDEQK